MDFRTAQIGGLKWRLRGNPSQGKLQQILADPDRWLSNPALILKQSPAAVVARIPGDEPNAPGWILKQFRTRTGPARLKNLFRSSRALHEFETAVLLERGGVLTARVVAAAERRKARVLDSCYLVMEEIGEATTLREFLHANEHGPARRRALDALAGVLARLHNAGFAHADLNPGNFLVRFANDAALVWLIDLEGIARCSSHSLAGTARELRRLNRRVQVSTFTRLRFLKTYCNGLHPALPARELAEKILAGQREWEIRRIGGRRWKVRLHLVNEQARALMANPLGGFTGATAEARSVRIKSTVANHPGFLLLRTAGKFNQLPDEKTVAFTNPLLGRERVGFALKLP